MAGSRSVSVPSKEASNKALHWAVYRRLGLVDDAGRADLEQFRRVAKRPLANDLPPKIDDLVSYADSLKQNSNAATMPKGAQATLRKKRKQAKLNRKKGRR